MGRGDSLPGNSDNLLDPQTHIVRGFLTEDCKILENGQRAHNLLVGKEYFICKSFFLYGVGDEQKALE